MKVKDLDPYMKHYDVVCGGKILGSKTTMGEYRKPWRGKSNRPWAEMTYQKQPPWMSMEVEEIIGSSIWAKEKKRHG